MIRVFIDESGTHADSPALTVGAYIARPKAWREFTKKWKWAIRPAKIYHCTDAAALQGDFKDWTHTQVAEVCKKALPLIPEYTFIGLAHGINMDDMREALKGKDELWQYVGSIYGSCLYWTLGEIMQMKMVNFSDEPIAFFHETNQFQEEANKVFSEVAAKYNPLGAQVTFSFGTKEDFVPLQAADVLAYECNKRLRNRERPDRQSLKALKPQSGRFALKYYDRTNMDFIVKILEKHHAKAIAKKSAPYLISSDEAA